MPKFETFGEFIRLKFKTQANAAKSLKTRQNVISNWATGRNKPEPDMQDTLRDKWGYDGPWPADKAQEAVQPTGGGYVTREDAAELRGRLEARIEGLERALEKIAEAVRELALRDRERSSPRGRE